MDAPFREGIPVRRILFPDCKGKDEIEKIAGHA